MVKNTLENKNLQEKYNILILYAFLKISRIFPGHCRFFFFSRSFPGLEIYFSRFSRVHWNPVQMPEIIQI